MAQLSNLERLLLIVQNTTDDDTYSLAAAYGELRLVREVGSPLGYPVEVSPALGRREMETYLSAFLDGVDAHRTQIRNSTKVSEVRG